MIPGFHLNNTYRKPYCNYSAVMLMRINTPTVHHFHDALSPAMAAPAMFSVSLKAMWQVGLLAYLLSVRQPSRANISRTRGCVRRFAPVVFRMSVMPIQNKASPDQMKNYSSESARDYIHPSSLPDVRKPLCRQQTSGGANAPSCNIDAYWRDSSRHCVHAAKLTKIFKSCKFRD